MEKSNSEIYNKNLNLFDEYLVAFQEDIKRIVGKFKKSFHVLSDNEVYSECNLHLLKSKEKIVSSFEDEMLESEFKKIAYHYCKNEAVWSHYRTTGQAYNKRRLDGVVDTEDGPKTTFDLAVESSGEENKDLDNDTKFLSHVSSNFFHILTKYSYLLTETETEVLSFLRKGMTQEEISEKLGVTHQAISHTGQVIAEKLKSQFSFEEIMDADCNMSIMDNIEGFNSFFEEEDKKITKEHKNKLNSFLNKYPSEFTTAELSKKLFDSKYSLVQISKCIKKMKLSHLVRCPLSGRFQGPLKEKAIKLLKKGLSNKEVANQVNREEKSVAGLRTHLVKAGLLKSIQKKYRSVFSERDINFIQKYGEQKLSAQEISNKFLEIKNKQVPANKIRGKLGHLVRTGKIVSSIPKKHNFSEDEKKNILELWQQGKSCAEISKILDVKSSLIPPVIGYFVRIKKIKSQNTKMFSQEQVNKIMNLYENNYKAKDIAKIMNIKNPRSISTLRGFLQRS